MSLLLNIAAGATTGLGLAMLLPLLQQIGVDVGAEQGSLSRSINGVLVALGFQLGIGSVLSAFLVVVLMQALLGRWRTLCNAALANAFILRYQARLFRALSQADLLFLNGSQGARFHHAATTEIDRAQSGVLIFLHLLTDGILTLGYLTVALMLSPQLTTIALMVGLALLVLTRDKVRRARQTGEALSQNSLELHQATSNLLVGMKQIRAFNLQERETRSFSLRCEAFAKATADAVRHDADSRFWFQFGSQLIAVLILYLSLRWLGLSAAGLLLLVFIFSRVIPSISQLQGSLQALVAALPAFENLRAAIADCDRHKLPDPTPSLENLSLRDEIRFEHVTYLYADQRGGVRDLSLRFPIGQAIALVGPSGAGKSTTVDLLLGLLEPQQGRIVVDDTVLTAPLHRAWRDMVAYVPQEPFFFNGSILENLLWAKPNASGDEIKCALEAVEAGFVVNFPDGLKSAMGDRGVCLSGGERQRLALARALLRRPQVLVLDEVSSAIDQETESKIYKSLLSLPNLTLIVITHRHNTLEHFDAVISLAGGSSQGILVPR